MNVQKFINLVHEHKCLWDQNDSTYHSRDHQRKSWREISEEMEIPVDNLKKKWRGLRDTFGRELRKVIKKQLGQATDTKPDSKWPYFKVLLFLWGTMSRRDHTGNNTSVRRENDTNISTGSDYAGSPASPIPDKDLAENSEKTPKRTVKSPSDKKSIKLKLDEIEAKRSQIEEEKIKKNQDYTHDSDTLFLLSLQPYLKAIPEHRKLMARTKLQQVLIDEQNDIASTVQYDYSSHLNNTIETNENYHDI